MGPRGPGRGDEQPRQQQPAGHRTADRRPALTPHAVELASLLRDLCRAYVGGAPPRWPEPADPDAFLALARRHRVTPLIAGLATAEAPAPAPLAGALSADLYAAVARHARLSALAGELIGALAANRVPVVTLKGLALADRYYRDPAHRPMRDVDLLVHRADVPRVLAIAAELGLARADDGHPPDFNLAFGSTLVLSREGGELSRPTVDLHWRPLDNTVPAAQARFAERLWERARPITVAGAPALAPAPADLLVHAAAHLALHHALDGLLWYCDLALLLRREGERIDWDAVLAAAAEARVLGALALALDMLARVLDVTPPGGVRARLARAPARWRAARRLAAPRVLALAPLGHLEYVLPLLVMDRGADVARTLGGVLLPRPAWVRLRYGTSSWPAGYARHGAWALGALAATVRRAR